MGEGRKDTARRPHIVIIGGGFAGVAAARKLRRVDVDITLVDRHTYNTFQPLLYQVATASLNPGDITWFLRALRADQSNVRFLKGTVVGMDHDAKTVQLDTGVAVEYDQLVISVGVTTNFFGVPGAAEYALPLYRRSQALAVRDQMFSHLEDAAINGGERDLRIIVVGGGATGVETAGAFAELRNMDMPTTYPELDPEHTHITLVEMLPHVLAPFHPNLREYARKSLKKRSVDLRLDTSVNEVRDDGVIVEHDGEEEFLPAGLVVWASGITAHDIIKDWNVPQGRGGRIETDKQHRVTGLRDVFAIGDVSIDPDDPLPQQAQPAIQGGKHVAKVIRADLKGASVKPFKYRDKGTMATIGRSSAVAQIAYLPRLKGFPAWIIWVGLHIAMLLGNRNRFATLTNLAARYLTKGSHNAIVGEVPDPRTSRQAVVTREEKILKAVDQDPSAGDSANEPDSASETDAADETDADSEASASVSEG